MKRPNQLKILLSDNERTKIERLALESGLTVSDWLRQQIRRAHNELFPGSR